MWWQRNEYLIIYSWQDEKQSSCHFPKKSPSETDGMMFQGRKLFGRKLLGRKLFGRKLFGRKQKDLKINCLLNKKVKTTETPTKL